MRLGPYLKDWHDERRPNLYWQEMNAEIAKGVKLMPNAALVPSEGLYDVKRDKIHFATPALRKFGLRCWEVFQAVEGGCPGGIRTSSSGIKSRCADHYTTGQ